MLKRVSIQNFKSLKDVTLDLQKVNLLIGPNNSGKTNFLKALELIGMSRAGRHAINQIAFAKDSRNEISIKLLWPFDITDRENKNLVSYDKGFEFYFSGTGQLERRQGYFNKQDITEDSDYISLDSNFYSHEIKTPILISNLEQLKIYKPDPNKLTQPSIVGTGAESVGVDASNLIAFFDYIRDDQPEVFERIKKDLKKCIPEFSEINFQSVLSNESLEKQFGPGTYKRIGLTDGRQGVKYWADELSEGTLYFLALLCIINQPNPPKLLLLEEPGKGIHPRRIREVMDFIFRLAEEKDVQIILTTHNEHVLDDFSTRPESVFVFDKDGEGATYVRNLQRDIIEPTNKRNRELGLDEIDLTTNLSENWLYGLLGGVPSIP